MENSPETPRAFLRDVLRTNAVGYAAYALLHRDPLNEPDALLTVQIDLKPSLLARIQPVEPHE